ncbi:hypothetical protein ACM66B_005356 [Microbotryomycetes sp. NB124-2]
MSIGSGATTAQTVSEPIKSVEALLDVLLTPLAGLELLDDRLELAHKYTASLDDTFNAQKFLKRQVSLVQQALVERVWPEWAAALSQDQLKLLQRWFCPSRGVNDHIRAQVCLSAWQVLSASLSGTTHRLSQPPSRQSVELASTLLVNLAQEFMFDEAHTAIAIPADAKGKQVDRTGETIRSDQWHRFVKTVTAVPARVANAWGALNSENSVRSMQSMPGELQVDAFQARMTRSMVALAWNMSVNDVEATDTNNLGVVLGSLSSSPDFATHFLTAVVPGLSPPVTFPTPVEELTRRKRHAQLWQGAIADLTDRQARRLFREVLNQFQRKVLTTQGVPSDAAKSKALAFLLAQLFGPLQKESLSNLTSVVLDDGSTWDGEQGVVARVIVDFCSSYGGEAFMTFFNSVCKTWSSAESIKHAGRSARVFLTALLLLSVASLPNQSQAVSDLATSPTFLNAVSTHLSLVEPTTRLLGMLVAEVVSERATQPGGELKPLSFGDEIWEGAAEPQTTARILRKLYEDRMGAQDESGWKEWLRTAFDRPAETFLSSRNVEPRRPSSSIVAPKARSTSQTNTRPLISVIGEDDPDDLPAYPLPAAPSASHMSMLESDDPSLYASALPGTNATTTRKRGRLRPPVYIPELTAYLKGQDPEGAKEEADGESERIEAGLNEGESLIRRKAGWGGEVAENAVDLTFTIIGMHDQYEIERFEDKRLNLLTALVSAAPTKAAPAIIEQYFHNNYSITQRIAMLSALALGARELAGLPTPVSTSSGESTSFPSRQLPPAMHKKLLGSDGTDVIDRLSADLTNVALSSARSEAETTIPEAAREKVLRMRRFGSSKTTTSVAGRTTYISVATEFFVMPLVNRFWVYVQDATSSASAGNPYTTGRVNSVPTLLEPIVLSKYFSTVAVLVHAARHAPTFTTVIVPSVLSLLIILKPSRVDEADEVVQASQMELLLTVFDAVSDLDHGASLVNSTHADGGSGIDIIMLVKEWAEQVFESDERRNTGLGRSGRASAGVLLRIDEVLQRWRGRVGWS